MSSVSGPRVRSEDVVSVLRKHQQKHHLSEEEFGEFVDAQLRTPGSTVRETIAKYDVALATAISRSRVLLPSMRIGVELTSSEKATVRRVFPDREFDFVGGERHDHGLAAVMRKIDRAVLRERVALTSKLVDIGGDYVYNLQSTAEPLHSCCPSVDVKDKFRKKERWAKLDGLMADPSVPAAIKSRVEGFLDDEEVRRTWMCEKKAEDCTHEADVLLATHVYDMTLEQMAKAMLSHRASRLVGCLIFSPDMLEVPEGTLPTVGGWYRVENEGKTIEYGAQGGSSWHYVHGLKELRRFAHDTAVVVGGVPFVYRVKEVRGDTLYYEMWFMDRNAKVTDKSRDAYTVSGGPWAVVDGYKFVADRGARAVAKVEPCVIRYPWDTWTKTLEYARGQLSNGRFTLEDLSRKLRTLVARTTVNSVAVSGVTDLTEDEVCSFLANVALAALHAVEVEKLSVHASVTAIQERRVVVSAWTAAWRAFTVMAQTPVAGLDKWMFGIRTWLRTKSLGEARVVSYRFDDGHRVVNVERYPTFSSLGPFGSVIRADFDKADKAARRDKELEETQDLMRVACAEDEDYAAAMRGILGDTLIATAELESIIDKDECQLFIDAIGTAVSGGEDDREKLGAIALTGTSFRTGSDTAVVTRSDAVSVEAVSTSEAHSTLAPVDVWAKNPVEAAAVYGITDIAPGDEVLVPAFDAAAATDYYRQAMREAISLYEAENRRTRSECMRCWEDTTIGGKPDKRLVGIKQGDTFNSDFYYLKNGRIEGKSFRGVDLALFHYSAVFVPGKPAVLAPCRTVSGRVEVDGADSYTGWVLANDATVIYNGPSIIASIESAIPRFDAAAINIVIRDGVPGCGKTTQILRGANPHDLILASGRSNTDATRRKKIMMDKESQIDAAKRGVHFTPFRNPEGRIRTYDSYLMSRDYQTTEVLHADECFMEHSGKLAAVMVHSRATRVELHGDTQQVPYVNRHAEEVCVFAPLKYRRLHTYKYLSYRCTMDAVALIAQRYEYKIRTTNKVVSSFDMRDDLPLVAIEPLKDVKYISFYQDDKAAMKKKCNTANTVAEVQGETFPKVALVRQQARKQVLLDSWPYVLVAVSRHTQHCGVYGPSYTGSILEKGVKMVTANPEYCRQFGDVATVGKPTIQQMEIS